MRQPAGEHSRPSLQEQIERTVAAWPELSPDQLARLAGLFRTGGEK